jgi:type III pantothenate kinase
VTRTVLLAVDVGNTNVTLGVFCERSGRLELLHHWRLATHREQTSDEVAISLRSLFDATDGPRAAEVTDAIVSCVVPPLLPIWERACAKLFGSEPLVVGPGVRTGMPIRYENPREVGADRIVNSVAALELVGAPVIAVDFGTATTFDCVSGSGEYLGGAIFPGIHVAMEALFARTSMLHRVEIARPKSVIGRTTTTSIQSGLLFGYAGMVDAMVERIREELGAAARVIATGGLAQRVAAETRSIERVEPFLTLEGLRILFQKNAATRAERGQEEKQA